MKKFTKIFLSCAMVSAVAAASASLAMAADLEDEYAIAGAGSEALNGVYTTLSNDVELDGIEPDPDTQVTFLVYKAGTDETVVTADNVIGIDQFNSGDEGETSVQPENSGLKAGSVTAPDEGQNKYIVKVGYYEDGTFKTSTAFFLTGEASGEDIIIGDVDDTAEVDSFDANAILWYGLDPTKSENTGKTINLSAGGTMIVGDVDDTDEVDSFDANAILWYGLDPIKSERTGETVVGTIVDTQN